jgi:hypothetical protein
MIMLKRLGVVGTLAVGLVLTGGAVQAGASGSTTVLKFYDASSAFTGIGFDANNPNAVPPVGASAIIGVRLKNIGSQFGKPSGTIVGRAILQCTVVAENSAADIDSICTGIAHVPNGYFTFDGNGGFSNAKVNYYDITGGVGPYINDRGEIKVTNLPNGNSTATVTLDS